MNKSLANEDKAPYASQETEEATRSSRKWLQWAEENLRQADLDLQKIETVQQVPDAELVASTVMQNVEKACLNIIKAMQSISGAKKVSSMKEAIGMANEMTQRANLLVEKIVASVRENSQYASNSDQGSSQSDAEQEQRIARLEKKHEAAVKAEKHMHKILGEVQRSIDVVEMLVYKRTGQILSSMKRKPREWLREANENLEEARDELQSANSKTNTSKATQSVNKACICAIKAMQGIVEARETLSTTMHAVDRIVLRAEELKRKIILRAAGNICDACNRENVTQINEEDAAGELLRIVKMIEDMHVVINAKMKTDIIIMANYSKISYFMENFIEEMVDLIFENAKEQVMAILKALLMR